VKVRVSALKEHEYCPRVIYLRDVMKIEPKPSPEKTKGLLGHAVRKELSLRQGKILRRASNINEIHDSIMQELKNILADVPFVYKEQLGTTPCQEYLTLMETEISNEIALMTNRLSVMVSEIGLEEALKLLTPWEVEYPIKSPALNLSGRIDKVMFQQHRYPVEIKTGEVSESVWDGDRMQTCAYAMLLEEKFMQKVPFGFVEYTRVQEQRPVLTTEQLRRDVLQTRDSVLEILDGKVPDICPHGSGRKCESCGYSDVCYTV